MYDSTSVRDAGLRGAGTLKVYHCEVIAFVGTLVAAVRRKEFVYTVFL